MNGGEQRLTLQHLVPSCSECSLGSSQVNRSDQEQSKPESCFSGLDPDPTLMSLTGLVICFPSHRPDLYLCPTVLHPADSTSFRCASTEFQLGDKDRCTPLSQFQLLKKLCWLFSSTRNSKLQPDVFASTEVFHFLHCN